MNPSKHPKPPSAVNETAGVPTRRFARQYGLDDLGFLDIARSEPFVDAEGLLKQPAVLIKALPWIGKTTFANRMGAWLSEDAKHKAIFGAFQALTSFEESFDAGDLLPPWWTEWKSSRRARCACWMIDALDECEPDRLGIAKRIVREITDAPAFSHRLKLNLIIFSRDRDWLQQFEDELRPLYTEIGSDAPLVLRMAPLDRDEAVRMLGSRSAFDRVADIIERHSGLAAIAGYPRVLTFLKEGCGKEPLSASEVWQGVLKDLLVEHNYAKTAASTTELEHRFEAVARIAAVCDLSGQHGLFAPVDGSPRQALTLEDIFPLAPLADRAKAMREAARDAIRIGGPFRSSVSGGLRFVHRNIRDWFCAFALRDLELDRLRAIVVDDQRPLPYLIDMLRLLKLVSSAGMSRPGCQVS